MVIDFVLWLYIYQKIYMFFVLKKSCRSARKTISLRRTNGAPAPVISTKRNPKNQQDKECAQLERSIAGGYRHRRPNRSHYVPAQYERRPEFTRAHRRAATINPARTPHPFSTNAPPNIAISKRNCVPQPQAHQQRYRPLFSSSPSAFST